MIAAGKGYYTALALIVAEIGQTMPASAYFEGTNGLKAFRLAPDCFSIDDQWQQWRFGKDIRNFACGSLHPRCTWFTGRVQK